MKNIIEKCNARVEHLKTPFLRADALLRLLVVEKSNLQQKSFTANRNVTEMLDSMNNLELVTDLGFAISLLDYYLKSNEFCIVIPQNDFSKDVAVRQMEVREILIQMINVEPNSEFL